MNVTNDSRIVRLELITVSEIIILKPHRKCTSVINETNQQLRKILDW